MSSATLLYRERSFSYLRTVFNVSWPYRLWMVSWDHFEILATGRSDMHCKIKESLLIRDLKPALNENVGSEKPHLYY